MHLSVLLLLPQCIWQQQGQMCWALWLSCRGVVQLSPHTPQCETSCETTGARWATVTNPHRGVKHEVKLLAHLQHFLDMLPRKATCLAADCAHPSRALFCLLPSGLRRRRLEAPPDGFRQPAVKKINCRDSTYHKLNCDCELLAQLDARSKMTLFISTSVFLPLCLHGFWFILAVHGGFYQACGQEQSMS